MKILLYLKGLAMGAADIVPGVSGGTIAFISGIYDELLFSIRSINIKFFHLLINRQFTHAFKHVNGTFLLILFAGISTSIMLLSRIIAYLLATYPQLLWSFFFGLILASALFISKQVKQWNLITFLCLVIGFTTAYYITLIHTIAVSSNSILYIFFCGMIAIIAMILPGISGSFILVLLGTYENIVSTLKQFVDALVGFEWVAVWEYFKTILAFISGCLIGLISFSHILTLLLKKYRNITISLLIGFMLGSLNKVWPWKKTISTCTNRHGEIKPLKQINISPFDYTALTGFQDYFISAILLAAFGFILVYGLEKITNRKEIINSQ